MVIWCDVDAGSWYISSRPASPGMIEKHDAAAFEALVPPNLSANSFLCRTALDTDAVVDVSRGGAVTRWIGLPVHPSLAPRLGNGGLMSAPFSTDQVSGRVFFTGMSSPTVEMLPLVELVAREIGGSIGQLHSYEKSRQLAITEDRIRVARDLHDGVLQSLTGIRLELQSMADQAAGSWRKPPSDRLLAIERALSIEQRELRRFIEDLKPTTPAPSGPSLTGRLEDLRQRIALEWRTPITIRVSPGDLMLPDAIDRDVPLMVHEAIVNALKHGQPSRVALDVRAADDDLRIIVEDDGRGFGFRGRRDHAALVASNAGPVSLRERVASLGGEIAIETGPSGSRVELTLPMRLVHV
jgi:signal transduction histidine kinase